MLQGFFFVANSLLMFIWSCLTKILYVYCIALYSLMIKPLKYQKNFSYYIIVCVLRIASCCDSCRSVKKILLTDFEFYDHLDLCDCPNVFINVAKDICIRNCQDFSHFFDQKSWWLLFIMKWIIHEKKILFDSWIMQHYDVIGK